MLYRASTGSGVRDMRCWGFKMHMYLHQLCLDCEYLYSSNKQMWRPLNHSLYCLSLRRRGYIGMAGNGSGSPPFDECLLICGWYVCLAGGPPPHTLSTRGVPRAGPWWALVRGRVVDAMSQRWAVCKFGIPISATTDSLYICTLDPHSPIYPVVMAVPSMYADDCLLS